MLFICGFVQNHKMKLIVAICIVLVAFVASGSASVLKPGRKSLISVAHVKSKMAKSRLTPLSWHFIFPGTNWCGNGDIADDYEDLGEFINTDKCCRSHDHCDDFIPPGESAHGLVNEGLFTRSNCNCDLTFYDCLGATKCSVSSVIGAAYFNVLGEKCFDHRAPATCLEYDDFLGIIKRCVKYSYDDTKPKVWQWFDVPKWIFGSEDTKNCNL